MRLEAFRLQNYKKINDTDWIECGDLMTFVGKNESGKTALLRGLSKLKPTDDAKYDPIKEFPHGRYTDEFARQDWPVASGRFGLTKEERKELESICPSLGAVKALTAVRHYSGHLTIEFSPQAKRPTVSGEEWEKVVNDARERIESFVPSEGKNSIWATAKQSLIQFIQSQGKIEGKQTEDRLRSVVSNWQAHISSVASEQWMKDALQPVFESLQRISTILDDIGKRSEADEWVEDHMPYFLYFGSYEILESAIYLPEFVRKVSGKDKSPKIRVQNALFMHVGVNISELTTLSREGNEPQENESRRRQIDELDIKANSASIAMTKKFGDWWEQRRHKFTYKFHGNYFRVWVSDDLDPTDVELEERSLGMRYFFSFYLLFIVEAEESHRECILLLDEPGLHLHGTAQAKLIGFLEKLAQKNQLFYTTHSPFMIDGSSLHRCRAVYETEKGTEISAEVWPRDKDTLFPLQAALGYSVCQSLFLSKQQCLVEGELDYLLLSVLRHRLRSLGKESLSNDVVLLPMSGTKNLMPLASMLVGHGIEIAVVLDCDPAGHGAINRLRGILADVDERCVLVKEFGNPDEIEELEDLIPQDYYISAVRTCYPNATISFTKTEGAITGIINRMNAFFERRKLGAFEKWRPMEVIIQDVTAGSNTVPPELYDVAERIFKKINGVFATIKPRAQ